MMDRQRSLQPQPGSTVLARDGEVGTLVEMARAPDGDDLVWLVVREREHGSLLDIPVELVDGSASDASHVRLRVPRADLARYAVATASQTTTVQSLQDVGDHLTVPLLEETLVPTTYEVEAGTVAIRKRVETVPAEAKVDVARDEVAVERVPMNRQLDAMPSVRQDGDTMVIPVVEEVLVTVKRLVLREEIRVTRLQRTETVTVRDNVRREVVDIEDRTTPVSPVPSATGTSARSETDQKSPDLPLT